MRKRSIVAGAVTCVAIALILIPLPVRAEVAVYLDIPQQRLDAALRKLNRKLGRKAGWNVSYDPAVKKYKSIAIRGSYTLDDALIAMLGNRGLQYERLDDDTIFVRALQVAQQTPADPLPRRGDTPSDVTQRSGSSDFGKLEAITLTGTRIRDLVPDAHVTIYDRGHIELSGAMTAAELVRKLPNNLASIKADSAMNNGGSIIAASNRGRGEGANLRGLGPGATLILVDGVRIAPAGSAGGFVDLSMIPVSAIERFEVTDGVSALYGSDGVAGTINIILRKDYQGAELSARYANTTRGGAQETGGSFVTGHSWSSGNAMLLAEISDQAALDARERSFIPQQMGPATVWPGQERSSAMARFHQQLAAEARLSGSLLYSTRSFWQDSSSAGFVTQSQGRVDLSHWALELQNPLPHDWQAVLSASRAMQEEQSTHTIAAGGSIFQERVFASRATLRSFGLQADGPVASLRADDMLLSIGLDLRNEQFDDRSPEGSVGRGLQRNVISVFGEFFVPLIGSPQRVAGKLDRTEWTKHLGLSLAARYDHYSGAFDAAAFNPRWGIVWSPDARVRIRGTHSRSFRVPPLPQSSEAGNTAVQMAFDDPSSPTGQSIGLLIAGGNHDLEPEKAQSFTVGLDLSLRRLDISLDYYNIEYDDRIATPLESGSPVSALLGFAGPVPFITRMPTAEQVDSWYGRYPVTNQTQTDASAITVIVDDRFGNISRTTTQGLEISARYETFVASGTLGVELIATRLMGLKHQVTSTVAPVDLANTVFQPTDLGFRAGFDWRGRRSVSSVSFNFTNSYQDNLVSPPEKVGSWLTVDTRVKVQLGAERDADEESDWNAILIVENLFDKDPPSTSNTATLGYDPTHASVLGRKVLLQLTKRW